MIIAPGKIIPLFFLLLAPAGAPPAFARDASGRAAAAPQSSPPPAATPTKSGPQKVVREGVAVEFVAEPTADKSGLMEAEEAAVRFKVTDAATGKPKDGLTDVRVLFFLSPGVWQTRNFAQPVGEGVYEASVRPPQPGVYMVFVESQSQGVSFRQLPHLMLHAQEGANTNNAAPAKQP